MLSKLPLTETTIIGCCNSILRNKTYISTSIESIVVNMSNSPLTQFTHQQEPKFSKSTLTMMKRVAKKTARRMSHKYSSSTFSGGCGQLSTAASNSKEFLSLDIARDSESLKLDRFINLLFSVSVLSNLLSPILRGEPPKKMLLFFRDFS